MLPTVGLFLRRVKLLPLYLIPVRVCVCACVFAHMRTKWLFYFYSNVAGWVGCTAAGRKVQPHFWRDGGCGDDDAGHCRGAEACGRKTRLSLICSKILSDGLLNTSAGHVHTCTVQSTEACGRCRFPCGVNKPFWFHVLLVIYLTSLERQYLDANQITSSYMAQSVQWQSKIGIYSTCTNRNIPSLYISLKFYIYISFSIYIYTFIWKVKIKIKDP